MRWPSSLLFWRSLAVLHGVSLAAVAHSAVVASDPAMFLLGARTRRSRRPAERDADVVEAVEQATADLVVDLEGDLAPGEADLLREQVDLALARVRERAAVLVAEHDRQQPDLGAVGVEDVGEARRDERAEAVVLQPPRCVLARGAAAEVLAGDEDRVGRQIPARLLGPVVEQELAEAGALDALEELLGHDLVGVDVGAVEMADRRR